MGWVGVRKIRRCLHDHGRVGGRGRNLRGITPNLYINTLHEIGAQAVEGKEGLPQHHPVSPHSHFLGRSWPFGTVAREWEGRGRQVHLPSSQSLSNGYCFVIMMNKVTGSCVVSLGTHVTQIVTGVSFLIGETGCRRDSAMVCGKEILGNRWFLVNRLQWLRPTLRKELIYQADLLMNRNRKNNHNTNTKVNNEAGLPVVCLTAVFLPGKEIAF